MSTACVDASTACGVSRPPTKSVDPPRAGEEGGPPCGTCKRDDDSFLWTDERWRLSAGRRSAVVQLMLETRAHVDLSTLPPAEAAELGPMLQRVERAVVATGDVGRVHVHRWGDGGSHFHLWLFGRPRGAQQLLGFGLPLWWMLLPPMPREVRYAAMDAIASTMRE